MSLSSQHVAETLDTESTRSIKKVTGSHKFKIMGYSLDQDIGKGKFLESSIFNVGGYNWSILYYPSGLKDAEDGYISIFLVLNSQAKSVKAQFSFTILDQRGSDSLIKHTSRISSFSTSSNNAWGFSSFAKRAELESNIKNDCFIIKGVVTVFKVFLVEPTEPIIVPPCNISQQLGHLLKHRNGADVTFEVDGKTFNAHKCILAARSPVFLAQFFGPMKEKPDSIIKIEEMEAPVFKSLLHFIYNDSLPKLAITETSESEEEEVGLMDSLERLSFEDTIENAEQDTNGSTSIGCG